MTSPTRTSGPTRAGRASARDLLRLLRERGPLSRSELAALADIAVSTASLRVDELVAAGLVEDAEIGRSRGGRRPRLVRATSSGGVVAAAELGSHHVRVALVSPAGSVDAVTQQTVDLETGPDAVLGEVAHHIDGLLEAHGSPALLGVGVGLPGPVDPATGHVRSPSRMPGWHDADVGGWLGRRFQVPALVDNDANLLAVGEYRARQAAQPLQHLVAVKVGRGIGCGLVARGHLHYGASGAAGDISHVRLVGIADVDALPCACGNRGCLETVASGAALLEQMGDAGRHLEGLEALIGLVTSGDPAANLAVRSAGRHLGSVLAVVVNFFNPEVLALGGLLATAEPFVASVRAAIYEQCLPLASESVTITPAVTGPDGALRGAAALVFDRLVPAQD